MTSFKTTRLLLVRHGQSIANAERRVQGWANDPLSELGQQQAQRLAEWMQQHYTHADVLYASPLRRAYQTAELVGMALGLSVQTRDGLKEVHVGDLEDSDDHQFNQAMATLTDLDVVGGESLPTFTERVVGTLHGLLAVNDGRTIVVAAHLGVIAVALAYWFDRDASLAWQKYGRIRNTSMTELLFHDRVELLRHGDMPHLE
ncbi:MAG: histidine phosphatase family protein [Chloroflexaceae bacterium]|nr:histidine phosphatase family protein [Chloroflexaceae bacterium]NJL33583.1 histidine phosphatase family protein [Chloroflexaceae bacterium]NJO04924.1 histidine phosphatase family protein [Chloroflexaceae bacterium]